VLHHDVSPYIHVQLVVKKKYGNWIFIILDHVIVIYLGFIARNKNALSIFSLLSIVLPIFIFFPYCSNLLSHLDDIT